MAMIIFRADWNFERMRKAAEPSLKETGDGSLAKFQVIKIFYELLGMEIKEDEPNLQPTETYIMAYGKKTKENNEEEEKKDNVTAQDDMNKKKGGDDAIDQKKMGA